MDASSVLIGFGVGFFVGIYRKKIVAAIKKFQETQAGSLRINKQKLKELNEKAKENK